MFRFTLPLLFPLIVWNVSHITLAQPVDQGGTTYITEIAWSPDGIYLAIAGANPGTLTDDLSQIPVDAHGYISVVNTITSEQIFLVEPPSAFTSVAWSPDGRRLALGSFDGTVWVVDATNGERLTNLFGHQATVTDVDWNPAGTQIVSSGNWDELVILWDALEYTIINQYTLKSFLQQSAFSVDDKSLAIGTQGGLFLLPRNTTTSLPTLQDTPALKEWIYQLVKLQNKGNRQTPPPLHSPTQAFGEPVGD